MYILSDKRRPIKVNNFVKNSNFCGCTTKVADFVLIPLKINCDI